MESSIILSVIAGIVLLLILILYLRIHAFISLLIASITVGLLAGLSVIEVIETVENGMAGTLGFVATVIGLGAILGGILEHSGATNVIVRQMIKVFGIENAPIALTISGFIIAIPVFFDVAFIILVPVIYALQRKTSKSLLLYAIPILAGLATTHAFIPPTPGPVAVADIIGVHLGWVILVGFIAGVPAAIVSGLLFGKKIANKIYAAAPTKLLEVPVDHPLPNVSLVIFIIIIPIILILLNTTIDTIQLESSSFNLLSTVFSFIGHPFVALIIANIIAWYFLGIKNKFSKSKLLNISTKSLLPVGTIILLTGAGGVFKQVLINTGAGTIIAEVIENIGLPLVVFGFIAAAIIRIIQGSATVAMITAAGLVSPLILSNTISDFELATIVIAIASGASILSHVNDSGFWLVSQYLGLTEKQTFQSWTIMTTLLALTGFGVSLFLQLFI